VNALILVIASGWVLAVTAHDPPSAARVTLGGVPASATPPIGVEPAAGDTTTAATPTRAQLLRPTGKYFGLSTPRAPFDTAELNRLELAAGASPTLIEYFVKWTEEFPPAAVAECYNRGAVPMISWEPWEGVDKGVHQARFALSKIAGGPQDRYIARFATAVRDTRTPVVIRFAHEMNGTWYPWSERRSGNKPGDYVKAWRHVHDIFDRVGAANVIWVWSPNILRPVPTVDTAPLYPGDRYVDWVGMVGYAAGERTAAEVFEPTIRQLRTYTRRPVLITETGARPGAAQPIWTADLFRWLKRRQDVIGFVWFEFNKAGATDDWRFSVVPATRSAFRAGLAQLPLTELAGR
jgi:hypothetical protein